MQFEYRVFNCPFGITAKLHPKLDLEAEHQHSKFDNSAPGFNGSTFETIV
jgi:hypothetical protein